MALSRRDFLKWSGAMGASLGVSSLVNRSLFAFSKLPPGEGYYLPTETRYSMCGTCDNHCGVLLHLQDGVIKEITGNPKLKEVVVTTKFGETSHINCYWFNRREEKEIDGIKYLHCVYGEKIFSSSGKAGAKCPFNK